LPAHVDQLGYVLLNATAFAQWSAWRRPRLALDAPAANLRPKHGHVFFVFLGRGHPIALHLGTEKLRPDDKCKYDAEQVAA
jgi:hypothetical protein